MPSSAGECRNRGQIAGPIARFELARTRTLRPRAILSGTVAPGQTQVVAAVSQLGQIEASAVGFSAAIGQMVVEQDEIPMALSQQASGFRGVAALQDGAARPLLQQQTKDALADQGVVVDDQGLDGSA